MEAFSPDHSNRLVIETDGRVNFWLFRHGTLVTVCPALTLTVGNEVWGEQAVCRKIEQRDVAGTVVFPVPRKYREVPDVYRAVTLHYPDYRIEFRLYNEGAAYRFVSTKANRNPVCNETVRYCFSGNPVTYTLLTDRLQNWFEQDYTVRRIDELPRDSFSVTPVLVKNGLFRVLLGEANVYGYPGIYLQPGTGTFEGIFARYPDREMPADGDNKRYAETRKEYLVPVCGNRTFPWRIAAVYDRDTDILKSELVYLLADTPPAGSDYSWVKPGQALWDWWNDRNVYRVNFESGINTETYLYLTNYAAQHGIPYLLIDEGWSERNDLLHLNPAVDMPLICRRAAGKGVGILLWSKWLNIERQMEEAFALFNEWGVKGVKIDFMDRNDARMVGFYEQVAQSAARHRLLVDFHGSYPCDGLQRKYPNVLTREGVIGLEYNKWSRRATVTHDVTIPYLRMWAGPMDYTPGAMLNAHPETFHPNQHEPMSQGTRSHQVAMYVVYESPLQMLSDSPPKYDENAESFGFIRQIPPVWDETVPLAGETGEYVAVARRKGNTWYIGALNGAQPRETEADVSFIPGKALRVTAHEDGPNAARQAKDFRITQTRLANDKKLRIKMCRGGGYAAIIVSGK